MENREPAYPPSYAPAPTSAPAPARPLPSGWGKLWAAFGLGVAAYLVLAGIEIVGSLLDVVVPVDFNALMAAAELAGGLAALLFVVALGGKAIARPSLKGMGEAWKAAAWLFLADGLFVVVEIVEVAMGIEPLELAADWPVQVGVLALLCLGVGLLEESTMRGLCLNGLLARMGRTRAGVYGAVILSALMFGLLHFDPFIDFGDPMQVAQNCMKVLQTGMCGFLFAAIMVKTRNLWAVVAIHATNDFMLLFLSSGLAGGQVETDYVQTGSDGAAILLLYCILCALYLPFIVVGKRLIDQASPWRGDFYHYGAPPTRRAAPAIPPAGIPVAQAVSATASATQPAAWAGNPAEPAFEPHKAYLGKHARVAPDQRAAAIRALTEGGFHDQPL